MRKRCKFCFVAFKTKNRQRKRCQSCKNTPADLLHYFNRTPKGTP